MNEVIAVICVCVSAYGVVAPVPVDQRFCRLQDSLELVEDTTVSHAICHSLLADLRAPSHRLRPLHGDMRVSNDPSKLELCRVYLR